MIKKHKIILCAAIFLLTAQYVAGQEEAEAGAPKQKSKKEVPVSFEEGSAGNGDMDFRRNDWGIWKKDIKYEQDIYSKDKGPETPKLEELPLVESLTKGKITWKFKEKARVGKFINGDYYVVGPVIITDIDPRPLFGDEVKNICSQKQTDETKFKGKYARNGSVLNQPADPNGAGYDSRIITGNYDPKQFTPLPIAMKPGDSLISTKSKDEPKFIKHEPMVKAAEVLICVENPLPPDAFRLSYCAAKDCKIYLARNIRRDLLYDLPKPGNAPDIKEWIRKTQGPWLDIVTWGHASPEENQPMYGQYYSNRSSVVSLMLQVDYSPKEKERLLINFIQYGIDLFGIVRAGYPGWQGHGGYGGGRKWPIIFSGLMLDDKDMKNIRINDPKLKFGEDTQVTFGKAWNGRAANFESHPVWRNPPTDIKPPSEWDAGGWQSEAYRRCCTSQEWGGQALTMKMMRAEKYWANDAFFIYVDSYVKADYKKEVEELKKGLEEGLKKDKEGALGKITIPGWFFTDRNHVLKPFEDAMWNAYREKLPPAK